MKKFIISYLLIFIFNASSVAEIDLKVGTLSGRVQTLSMFRDYEKGTPTSEYSHSVNLQVDVATKEFYGLKAVGSYSGVGVLDSSEEPGFNSGERQVLNGKVNVINEGYLQYRFADLNASNTIFAIGRKAQKNEIFRYTEARNKKRSEQGIYFETKDIPKTKLIFSHTKQLSNIYGLDRNDGLSWDFDNYADVFNYRGAGTATTATKTDGITHLEATFSGVPKTEVALFDAYAWEVANVVGSRVKYNICENTAIEFQYRNEKDVGDGVDHNADVFSLALIQKVGPLTVEAGYFGVHGGTLRFEENTTGINHALNYSLLLDTAHFNGGADTAYLKAVAKIHKTVIYTLLNATSHSKQAFNGTEVDLVVKQNLSDSLIVCFKGSLGYREPDVGSNQTQGDARVFVTYKF